jgi:hypothetical protein
MHGFKDNSCITRCGAAASVIPGHDPLVLERYPAARPELQGWIARLD